MQEGKSKKNEKNILTNEGGLLDPMERILSSLGRVRKLRWKNTYPRAIREPNIPRILALKFNMW